MKTFGEYVSQRLQSGSDNPMGMVPGDVGIMPKPDRPMDHDQEAQISRLVQLAKRAVEKHPELMVSLLEKIANKDEEIRAGLDAVKNDTLPKGKRFNDRGLGHAGSNMDHVVPNDADSGGGNDALENE